jgi:hypothetical protein
VVEIKWPVNTAPGLRAQDGAGRLINCFPEQRQNDQGLVWRRVPGTVFFTDTYPADAVMTGTITVLFGGQGGQGTLSAGSVSGTALFIGTTA